VIDNNSTDQTSELSKITQDNFKYIRNETNVFHSQACNQGYELSESDNVMFLNNDIKVKSNFTSWTQDIIDNCDKVVGPTMGLLDKDFNFIKESNQQLTGNSYLSGWCIASNKSNWEKVKNNQIWDEQFPLYFNDGDLSFRFKQLGIPLEVVNIPVVHFGKVSSKQLNIHKLYTEARKVFIKKWK
jgi:GT2 family glycosyltransferase